MPIGLLENLSLIDISGQVILLAIIAAFVASVICSVVTGQRYASMLGALADAVPGQALSDPVLDRIVRDCLTALHDHPRDVNHQAIVERDFQRELRGVLTAERFVRASPGLVIILGLVGTFYGLTLSIGRLAALVAGDQGDASGMTLALTRGLTEALSGMSVAFTTSLFGIFAAILLTLIGVFWNVADRRTVAMVQIETFVDRTLSEETWGVQGARRGAGGGALGSSGLGLEPIVAQFGSSVAVLGQAVDQFESALETFATTTRDFREFNLHLKDNVQRMSLAFGDFSEALKSQAIDNRNPR